MSTGGTAKALIAAGVAVTEVGEYTKFPEILNGRVKTLHPLIHGGLLAVRGNEAHAKEMEAHGIKFIDIVVCNLYPFASAVASGGDFGKCIENIDIGGPCMIRAAAKNCSAIGVLTNPSQYAAVIEELETNKGQLSYKLRCKLAADAFTATATYDSQISQWFQKETN